MRLAAIFLLLSSVAIARDPSAEDAVNLFQRVQRNIKKISDANPVCFTCQYLDESALNAPESAKVCEDLFSASCEDENGRNKFEGRVDSSRKEANALVNAARDKTAQQMGFKSFDEAFIAKLNDSGIEVVLPLDAAAWSNLKRENSVLSYGGDGAKKLFRAAGQCTKDYEDLLKSSAYMTSDLKELRAIDKRQTEVFAQYREKSIQLYAKDIPSFLTSHIQSKCSQIGANPQYDSASSNLEIKEICKKLPQLKREAVEIFRIEGSSGYRERSEAFVRKNYLPEFQYSSPSINTATDTEASLLKTSIQRTINDFSSFCYSFTNLLESTAGNTFVNFANQVNKSKPTVETLIDSFYSPKDKAKLQSLFRNTRKEVKAVAAGLTSDSAKTRKILDGYDNLALYWLEKPSDSLYVLGKNGIPVMDESQTSVSAINAMSDDVFTAFADPSLKTFTQINANYLPAIKMGEHSAAERVHLLPNLLRELNKNSFSLLAVTAHEAGHKVGPALARLNGHGLNQEYAKLLSCYQDGKSINLQAGQEDETVADYISSEVLAGQIEKLPKENRKAALRAAMEIFCLFDEVGEGVDCRGAHPSPSLRVSGIYGANPHLRKSVGCEADSSKYKSCGMQGSAK
jgi:hypothetical protein